MLHDPRAIKRVESPDGKKIFELMRRDDGFYSYHEYAERTDKTPDGDYTYWGSTFESGIFEDEGSALRDALSQLPWLKGQISN